jgi:hypothetical protein
MSVRTWRVGAIAIAAGMLLTSAGAWAQSGPACQNVGNSVCGAGSGVISSVSGDVSLGRAGAVNPTSGGAISGGDRILAGNGTAQVSLGPACVVCVPANSISVVTSQQGLTCLSNAAACSGEASFSPGLVGAGVIAVGGAALIAIGVSTSSKSSVSP